MVLRFIGYGASVASVVATLISPSIARADEGEEVANDLNDPTAMPLDSDEPWRPSVQVRPVVEAGFLATMSNFGEFGTRPSRLDFRNAAGQENLNLYTRWSVELDLGRKHTFVFLYQPLSTSGTRTPSSDVRLAGETFRGGVPLHTDFNFPFYRLSYLFRFVDTPRFEFQGGLTGQIRNANYTYEQTGVRFARNSDVGFVPALKVRVKYTFKRGVYFGLEADGIYAPISVLNGSSNDTVGAILDASVRVGYLLPSHASAFLNFRYLGGGATNTDPAAYAKNWLHFLFVGLGATYDLVSPP